MVFVIDKIHYEMSNVHVCEGERVDWQSGVWSTCTEYGVEYGSKEGCMTCYVKATQV